MPITISTETLLNSREALRELSDLPIPVRTALKLRKIYNAVEGDLKTTEEMMKKLVSRHAKKDAEGNQVHPQVVVDGKKVQDEGRVEIEDRVAYEKDVAELLASAVVVDFDAIKADDLVDPRAPTTMIKTSLLFTLIWLLEG
jgi:hypothetical protein